MKSLLLLAFLFSHNLYAWTLNSSTGYKFSSGTVTIKVASDTCSNAGFTPASITTLINDSIAEFWNSVPTSSIDLSCSGNSGIAFNNVASLTTAAYMTSANTIIVGCTNSASVFSSTGTLAVGGLACQNGTCYGAVLLNDTASTYLASADRQTILATFSHELGHALGLGHSSVPEALMYYNISNKTQLNLHQDDIDGISYLYPNQKKLGGLVGACGTVNLSTEKKNNSQMPESLLFLCSLMLGGIFSGGCYYLFKTEGSRC